MKFCICGAPLFYDEALCPSCVARALSRAHHPAGTQQRRAS